MSDKELNFSELFENSKTKQARDASDDERRQSGCPAYYNIETIPFDIVNPVPKFYKSIGINRAGLRQFKKNQDNLLSRIDLHGYHRQPAIEALASYIRQCQSKSILYFLVIFGKGISSRGEPILKKVVCSYMMACEEVLAYEFAKAKDGGDGAAYVMLRKE